MNAVLPDTTFSEQLAAERPYLLRFAKAKLGGAHAAEDMVQDTMVAALVGKSPYLGQSAMRTWMVSIPKHKITDYYRAPAVRCRILQPDPADDDAQASWPESCLEPNDSRRQQNRVDPKDEAEKGQLAASVMSAIDKLPARQRDAFVLVHMHGYSSSEAAARVGVSCANLWIILHRTRKALQSTLQHTHCS